MEFVKLNCTKDNVINSSYTGSNQGYSPVLEIYSKPITNNDREVSRVLLYFDLTDYDNAINQNILDPDTMSMSATLKLYNVYNKLEEKRNATYNIYRITNDWLEGTGYDVSTTGISNWYQRDTSNLWTTTGGDFAVTSITSVTFSTGDEDWVIDIKDTLSGWQTGAYQNYGLLIKLDDNLEFPDPTSAITASVYGKKVLYGREANNIFTPSINIQWKNKFTDNSSELYFGSTGEVLFYNRNKQGYADLNGTSGFPGYLSITGAASTSLSSSILMTNVAGTRIDQGIYKFNLPTIPLTGASLTSTYIVWTLTSSLSAAVPKVVKQITINSPVFNQSIEYAQGFTMSVMNFKDRIITGDKIRYSVFFKKITDTLTTLTAGSTALNSYIVTEGYWKIVDEKTGTDVYPWMDLNYNDLVNYFVLDTKYLKQNRAYRIVIKIIEDEREFYFDAPKYFHVFYLYVS